MATRYTLIHSGKKLSALAATTSAELAGVISDETGSDKLVFNTAPTFATGIGINTYSATYPLQVDNGATAQYPINLISSSKFVRIGCLNSTYAHVDTDATQGFYFYDKVTTGSGNNEFAASSANSFVCGSGGNFGIGVTSSQGARLHIAAGTASANTAPLKFNSGVLLSAPVAGVMEFLTDGLYFTITTGAARKTIAFTDSNITGKAATAGRADSAIVADGLSVSGLTLAYQVANGVPSNNWAANCPIQSTGFYGPLTGNVTGNCTGTSANVTGTVAVTNGGTGTTTAFTTGSVVFAGGSGVYTQDNTNFFFDDTNNRLAVGGITSPAQRFVVGYGHMRFDSVAAPSTPTTALAGAGAGNLSNGDYRWTISYVTADGETTCSTRSVLLTVVDKTTNGKVNVTYTASSNPKVTNIKIYRDKVGVDYWYHLVDTVANTNGTYLDNVADTSLPAARFAYGQESNTTAGKIFVDTNLAMFCSSSSVNLGIGANPNNDNTSVAIGRAALFQGNGSSLNVAVGYTAMYNTITGVENTAVGCQAMGSMTGSESTGVGRAVMYQATGTGNTGVGYYAGYSVTSGTKNIFLGWKAGYYETGSSKLFIDNQARTNEATGRTDALIYGVFNATAANQTLALNAAVTALVSVGAPKILTPEIKTDTTTATDLTVTTGANQTLLLGTVVWDDARIMLGNISRPGGSDPAWVAYDVNGGGVSTYLLEFAKNNYGTFTVQLPHSYKTGTDIAVHAHWTPGARGTAESGKYVGWKLQYSWANINANFGTMATVDLSDACDGTNHKHQMTPDVTIDGHTVAKGISSMLVCNITRTDTGADDDWVGTAAGQLPMLLEVDFHFQIDTIGSRQQSAK